VFSDIKGVLCHRKNRDRVKGSDSGGFLRGIWHIYISKCLLPVHCLLFWCLPDDIHISASFHNRHNPSAKRETFSKWPWHYSWHNAVLRPLRPNSALITEGNYCWKENIRRMCPWRNVKRYKTCPVGDRAWITGPREACDEINIISSQSRLAPVCQEGYISTNEIRRRTIGRRLLVTGDVWATPRVVTKHLR
jgi:hypothetical protein